MRIDFCADDFDAIFGASKSKGDLVICKQISLKICLLLTYPSYGEACGDEHIGVSDAFTFKFTGNSGKGENKIILIGKLICRKFLMTYSDGIILLIRYKQGAGIGGFGIAFLYSGWETAVCRFHIPITVVDTDNVRFIKFFHFYISPFLL